VRKKYGERVQETRLKEERRLAELYFIDFYDYGKIIEAKTNKGKSKRVEDEIRRFGTHPQFDNALPWSISLCGKNFTPKGKLYRTTKID